MPLVQCPDRQPESAKQHWYSTRRAKLLLLGIMAVLLSNLFFVDGFVAWLWLLLGGLVLTMAAWIGLAAMGWKGGSGSTVMVAAGVALWVTCAPAIRHQSYRMFVDGHRGALERAAVILAPVTKRSGGAAGCHDGLDYDSCMQLSILEEEIGGSVRKSGQITIVSFHSFVGGILLCPGKEGDPPCSAEGLRIGRRITGNWYRWSLSW